ncbi:putative immune-responsive protein [Rosellinia necatrix]|uniref:Putative immune-responsive protein n=1 Tax=Rosellinia necatrix TaxID=77044 RepID=A0A1W2TWD7_ROSNE|nr:putative immune-responsive protein [Rosellinia necatrix]
MVAPAPNDGHPQDPALDENNGVTSQLSQWITNLELDEIPSEIRERAKHLILDGIVCGLVGARVPWSEECVNAVLEFEPPGYCTVIGYEKALGPLAAAVLNGAFIQATELDDYHSGAPLHSAAVVLPALFAAAQVITRPAGEGQKSAAGRVSGRDFLLAAVAGFETGPRAGLGCGGTDLLKRGWHSGPIFGCPAAAAASSKLLGLSADDVESAIGVACTQAGGLMAAQYEGMVKRVQHAFAARNGLFGALLCRKGYVGIKKVFERRYGGFLSMFSQGNGQTPQYDSRRVVEELGSTWQLMNIRIKLYACVGGCHGQIEALAQLQATYPERFAPENLTRIEKIEVYLSGAIFAHDGWAPEERPMTETGAQMNAAYIGAVQLIDRQVLLAQFAADTLNRDEIWNLVYKTTCYHDTHFDKPHHVCGARVVVTFDDGTQVEEIVNMPKGYDPPITDEEIRMKYRRLAASAIDQDRMEKIEQLVVGLESLEDVSELLDLLPAPTRRVLG